MPIKCWFIEEKKQHVQNWRARSLIRQQYCELHAIPFTSMREWPQDVAKAERRKNESGLLPVHIATKSPAENMPQVASDPVMLFLPGSIHMSCHPTQLTDVFRALKHANT